MNIPSELMKAICNDPDFGYTQGSGRWGNGITKTFNIDGKDYYIDGGDRDCSAAIISVYNSCYPNTYPFGSAYYTGNMVECALETGKWKDLGNVDFYNNLQPGDVLVRDGHTEMYVGDGKLAGFRHNENGEIIGGNVGDQTGDESSIVNWFASDSNPWHAIRYIGDYEPYDSQYNIKWPKPFRFLKETDVHVTSSLGSEVVATYDKGEVVYLNGKFTYNEGCIWAEYNGAKTGVARYVIVGVPESVEEF